MKDQKSRTFLLWMGLGLLLLIWGLLEYLTLLKLLGLGLMGYGLYRQVRSQRQPKPQEEPLYQAQDGALSQEIQGLQRRIKLLRTLRWVLGAVGLLLAVTQAIAPAIVVAILLGIAQLLLSSNREKLKQFVADNIVQQALQEVFEVTEYQPFGCIDARHIQGSNFGVSAFESSHGSDYVKGFYKGLPIELCDLRLTREETRITEDGSTETYDLEVFKGFWLICDFQKTLSADLRLWERGSLGKLAGGKGIQTENEKFNRHFQVESEIEQEAFYILTPHMMEYILEMDRKARGQTHIRFERGGRMQIAIRREQDAFEVGKKMQDATLLRKQFVQEIRYITDLIDELRLVDTLYKA